MARIELMGVTKIFGRDTRRAAAMLAAGHDKDEILEATSCTLGLRDVTLSIEAGETFVVMGLSGSGKSTLLRHINRLIEPTAGTILVDGEDVLGLDRKALTEFRRRRMGMVFQGFGLFPHRTVLENIAFGLDVRDASRTARRTNDQTARHWVEMVGLSGYENAYPQALSGGMRQRVGLARALATDADILLMDEPFGALDPLIRRDMQDQLLDLQSRLHKTIVFITHDLDEALRLGDRIAILRDGAVVQVGSAEDILTAPADGHVAEFLKDINRGRVLTAGSAKVDCSVIDAAVSPAVALESIDAAELRVAYVVDAAGQLLGAVTGARLRRAARENARSLRDLAEPVATAPADMVLEEILPLTLRGDFPVAVLDGQGRVAGMLSREAIIAALAKSAGPTEDDQAELGVLG